MILLWPNTSHKLTASKSERDAFLYAITEACEHYRYKKKKTNIITFLRI